jgi:MSHA biogenesis protein MshN
VPKAEPKPPPVPTKPVAHSKPAAEKPKLERQERFGTVAERAESEFRQAVSILKLGRGSEAETRFLKALEFDASHRGARQALVAIYLERGQLDAARKLLQDGLTIDPGQPDFAIALARIYVERRDLSGALAVLDRSAGVAGGVPEFHVLRGTLLQRLGRHAEAADSYLAALQTRATLPQAWVGLGISYEQLGKRPEAAEAFRRSLAAGELSAELKTFAEQRIRALR